jgi:hypothetical protein
VVVVLVELDHAVEELLEVDRVHDELLRQPLDEPRAEGPVVGLDLSMGLGVSRLGLDPVAPELGEPLAEGPRVEDRRPVQVDLERQPPAPRGEPEDADRREQVGRGHDDRGQNSAGRVVEDREHMEADAPTVGELELDRPLGVALPDPVRLAGDEPPTTARLLSGLLQAGIALV